MRQSMSARIFAGRFEDPYKNKVKCWIKQNIMFVQNLGNDRFPIPGSIPEKLDLMLWKVFSSKYLVAQKQFDERIMPHLFLTG